ncbi:pyrimidine reductase family protein [Mycobacterium sp.]|uniref:pyrimidine reductase family protein n=1 Tax=Mycobacterium sp. TaxID=1785 RepID=UPI0031DA1303
MPDAETDPGAGQPGGTRLRLLGPVRTVGDDELIRLYDYPPDHRGPWVRANFIASLDGGATVEGTTAALGGPVDRALFAVLRELADVILVGAGTVRVEGYAGAQLTVAQRQRRQARGQSEVPPLAIVTKSGDLHRDLPVFTRTEVAPLVLTCAAAFGETQRRLGGLAEVIDCSGDDPAEVEHAPILAALAGHGLHRVLTEGGPALLGWLLDRGLLDDMCLTIAPCLVGGQAGRIAAGPGQGETRMRCAHVLADADGYLYTRYVKTD